MHIDKRLLIYGNAIDTIARRQQLISHIIIVGYKRGPHSELNPKNRTQNKNASCTIEQEVFLYGKEKRQ